MEDADGQLTPLATQIGDEHREELTGRFQDTLFEQMEAQWDIREALERLSYEDQDLCWRLTWQSLSEISEDLLIHRNTLRDRILELRQQLQSLARDHFFEKSTVISDLNWEG